MASVTSGFAGVYIEKILKRGGAHQVSLWMRNIQLAGFSLLFASFGVWSKDRAEVVGDSILSNFGLITPRVPLLGDSHPNVVQFRFNLFPFLFRNRRFCISWVSVAVPHSRVLYSTGLVAKAPAPHGPPTAISQALSQQPFSALFAARAYHF
jgi:hypothetical protein